MENAQTNKPHVKQTAGKKAQKKKENVERHNPKAFTYSGGAKSVYRRLQHTATVEQKRLHHSIAVSKAVKGSEPPIVVVVQGPPQCGKTTLIKSFIKHYCQKQVDQVKGTITVTASKNRRITFIECSNSISTMLDLAKVADLVLLVIDAEKGFEKDTFEFISILKSHGFPKVIGVLTHLDAFKESKKLKKLKKSFKKRFWADLFDGATLFYLSKLKHRTYLKKEIQNLCLFISVQKYKPFVWRSQHPYLLALNTVIEEDGKVSFYGYLNGSNLMNSQMICIPGVAITSITSAETLNDPCPPIVKGSLNGKSAAFSKTKLIERNFYAPLCVVNDVELVEDAVYLKQKVKSSRQSQQFSDDELSEDTNDNQLVWSDSAVSNDEDDVDISDHEVETTSHEANVPVLQHDNLDFSVWKPENALDVNSSCSFSAESEYSDDDFLADETELAQNFSNVHQRFNQSKFEENAVDYTAIIYGDNILANLKQSDENDSIFGAVAVLNESELLDSSKQPYEIVLRQISRIEELVDAHSDLLIASNTSQSDSEFCSDAELNDDSVQMDDMSSDNSNNGGGLNQPLLKFLRLALFATGGSDETIESETRGALIEKYDEIARTALANRNAIKEFCKQSAYPVGTYIKLSFSKFSESEIETYRKKLQRGEPFIIGGIGLNESNLSFLKCKVIKHRWQSRVLKSTEPLLFSLGWFRFQSLPYFAMEDRNEVRLRFLKYTPEHLHCLMFISGFSVPPNTGILAMKYLDRRHVDWRIALTGSVLATESSPKVVKKLKLVGDVNSIKINTAFIKNMFSSAFEVNRCVGAKIQTTSGIRGLVKKAHGDNGEFRATFEAKIQPNDVILMKTWVRVPMEPFVNPMTDSEDWDRLRSFNEVRRDLKLPTNRSEAVKHAYRARDAEAEVRVPKLKLDSKLVEALPYKTIPKLTLPQSIDPSVPEKPPVSEYDKYINSIVEFATHKARLERSKKLQNLQEKHDKASKQSKANFLHSFKDAIEVTKQHKKQRYAKINQRKERTRQAQLR